MNFWVLYYLTFSVQIQDPRQRDLLARTEHPAPEVSSTTSVVWPKVLLHCYVTTVRMSHITMGGRGVSGFKDTGTKTVF